MVKRKNYFSGKQFFGALNGFYGKKHTDETKKKLSISKKGNKHCLGRKLSDETKEKIRNAQLRNVRRGKSSNLWKHGNYPKHLLERRSSKYKIWRETVFKRDDFTCQNCFKKGLYLNAHHIKPFSLFPELRFVISNGITYCKKCHIEIDPFIGKRIKSAIKKSV